MMVFHRVSASVGKTALVGSLYTLGFVGLASASMIVALMYLPWSLAMNVLGQMTPATLDAIRGIGISSFFGWFALFAFGMGMSLTFSAFLTQRKFKIPRSRVIKIFVLAAILALWASSAFIVPQVTAISSTQTAEYSQFNTKPCSFYIFTDSTNYYAQNCDTGAIAYGGAGNAGGATGTSFASVFTSATGSSGLEVFASGTYSTTALTLSTASVTLQGPQTAIIQLQTGAASLSSVLTITGTKDKVDGLTFDAQGPSQANGNIRGVMVQASDVTVQNSRFRNMKDYGLFVNSVSSAYSNIGFYYNVVEAQATGLYGSIGAASSLNHGVRLLTIEGNRLLGQAEIFLSGGISDSTIQGNTVLSCNDFCIDIESNSAYSPTNIAVTGNTVVGGPVGLGFVNTYGVTAVANTVNATTTYGAEILWSNTEVGLSNSTTLSGNHFNKVGSIGIYVNNPQNNLQKITGVIASENHINYPGTDGINAQAVVGFTATSNQVLGLGTNHQGLVAEDCQGVTMALNTVIKAAAATGTIGVIIGHVNVGALAGTKWTITDNDLSQTATPISLLSSTAGTFVIQSNIGYPTSTLQKSESGADTNVLTFTPPPAALSYCVNFVMDVSAANAATLGWTITYTDGNGNVRAPTNLALFQEGTAAPALTFTTSVVSDYHGSYCFSTNNAGTNIVIKLTFTGTSFTAQVSAWIVMMQQ